jgi:hypothetical protein
MTWALSIRDEKQAGHWVEVDIADVVCVSGVDKNYHRDGREKRGEDKVPLTRDYAAEEGFTPCRNCKSD